MIMNRIELPEKKIKRLYNEGMTITELAKKFYVAYNTMWRFLDELGIIRRKPRVKFSPDELKRTYKFGGSTLHELAKIHHVSTRTMSRVFKRSRIKPKGKDKPNNYMPIIVQYLRKEKNLKLREIAEKIGISQREVNYLMKVDINPIIKELGGTVNANI